MSTYIQSNEDHDYDGEFYEGYACDHEKYSCENYYSRDKYERNRAYGFFNEHEGVEVSYDEFNNEYEGYEGSHITHQNDKDDASYDFFSDMSYELFERIVIEEKLSR